jgi:acyl dehydratase
MTTWFDDLAVGYRSEVGRYRAPLDEAIELARRWEPAPYHVDEAAARESIYGGITLCSLHLFAIVTRLFFDHADRIAVLGMLGKDAVRLPRPARPDQELVYTTECVEHRASRSKTDRGVVVLADSLIDPSGEPVLEQRVTLLVARRPAG